MIRCLHYWLFTPLRSVEVFRNSPSTTFVSGRGTCPGVFLAAGCQRRSVWAEHCAGGVFRWAALSYPLHQPDFTGSQWSENKGTGTGAPQWWMALLRAVTANAIPRGSAARKCSYKCVYALCLLHFSPVWWNFVTTDFHWNKILNYAAVNIVLSHNVHYYDKKWSVFLSDPLKFTSNFFCKGKEMVFRYKWADLKEVKAAYRHLL